MTREPSGPVKLPPLPGDDPSEERPRRSIRDRLERTLRTRERRAVTPNPAVTGGADAAAEAAAKAGRARRKEGPLSVARARVRGALFDNPALKFVALVLAITLFILVNTNKDALIGVDVGVVYTMPEDRVLISDKVDQVRVTIKGSWRRIKRFDHREIDRINVDLTNLRTGEYRFPKDAIRLPPGLTLLDVKPASIPLRFEPLERKIVPVHVPTVGRPNRGFKLDRIVAKPSQVTIQGAASAIRATERLSTVDLDLSGHADSFFETLSLVSPRPDPIVQITSGSTVDVEVAVTEEMTTRTIEAVAVDIRPGPGYNGPPLERYSVEPQQVDVALHGSLLALDTFTECIAFVEVYPDDATGRARQAAVRIQDAPQGVGIEVLPPTVTLRVGRGSP